MSSALLASGSTGGAPPPDGGAGEPAEDDWKSPPPPAPSSWRSESATHGGVSRLSIHSASPESLCLKSGARGFRLLSRLSQYWVGCAKNCVQRASGDSGGGGAGEKPPEAEPSPPPPPPPLPEGE